MADDRFDTPQDALAHYGKKGMHWGIRNEEKPIGRDGGSSKDDAGSKRPAAQVDPKTRAKNMAENHKKFLDKFEDHGPPLGGQSPKDQKREAKAKTFDDKVAESDKHLADLNAKLKAVPPGIKGSYKRAALKQQIVDEQERRSLAENNAQRVRDGKLTTGQRNALIAAGVGATVAGALVYSSVKQNQKMNELQRKADAGDVDAKMQLFDIQVAHSKFSTWGMANYITKESWDREEFELPAGHTFNRLSTKDEGEHGFNMGTYCTSSTADLNRYVKGFRAELGHDTDIYHVTFTAKTPTKVPNLDTTIESMRKAMSDFHGVEATKAQAITQYKVMSGGKWNDPLSEHFFHNLRTQGYGAIVDEMDAGVIGEKPLVFFNSAQASPKKASYLDSHGISLMEKSVELMPKPPRK